MAIAVTQPVAGSYLGAGIVVFGTCAGPTLLDDEVTLTLADFSTGAGGISGRVQLAGDTAWVCRLGYDAVQGTFTAAQSGLAFGHAVQLLVDVHHANGTPMESDVFNFLWDAVSGLPGLFEQLRAGSGGSSTLLEQILAAVTRTYTTS